MAVDPMFTMYQEMVYDTNINTETLLATDYLNHFNEVVMMIQMLGDMPDCLEMVKEWEPKEYTKHFEDSGIADRELAVEVYDFVPPRIKQAFEKKVAEINGNICVVINLAEELISEGHPERIGEVLAGPSQEIQSLQDQLSSIIHGTANFGDEPDEEDETFLAQDDIDALFS